MQEFKTQLSFHRRAEDRQLTDESLVRDFYFRYEQHREVLKKVQIEWQLLPTYNVVTVLSREVSFVKLQENHALNGLFNLLGQRKLDGVYRMANNSFRETQVRRRPLVDARAAGEYAGLSSWTMRRKAYAGEIASLKIGSRLLFDLDELDRFLDEHTRPRLIDKSTQRTRLNQSR